VKVTLVIPQSSLPFTCGMGPGKLLQPPMGVLSLAAATQDDHDVNIIDSRLFRLSPARIAEKVVSRKPDVVGISVNYSTLIKAGTIIATRVREALGTEVPIIWGGNAATFNHGSLLQSKVADMIVLHEGDRTFPALLRCIEQKHSAETLSGVAFRQGESLVRTDFTAYIQDLDSLPFPSYKHLASPERYLRGVVTSRGCSYACIYCSTRAMWGKWRSRSAGNILAEVQQHVEDAAPPRIHFVDDNFPVDRIRVRDICEGMQAAGWTFVWGFSARLEMVDEELLRMCARAGCDRLYFGIESGSPRVLERLGRRYGPEDVMKIVDSCLEMGILPTCSFMLGIPYENDEDVQRTFDLMQHVNTPMVQIHVFTPLPGTPVYENPERFNVKLYLDGDTPDCILQAVFHETAHLSRERIAELWLEGHGIAAERSVERPAYDAFLGKGADQDPEITAGKG